MQLHHYRDPAGNFGDDLNLWFWDLALPGWQQALPDRMLVGVGTLLNDTLPRGMPKLVVGSGAGYGTQLDRDLWAECEFAAVRGPATARALGLPETLAMTDPAALLPLLDPTLMTGTHGEVVLVPHHRSIPQQDWPGIAARAGARLVSPTGEARAVIGAIAGSRLALCESLHAAIVADAFGVPWVAFRASRANFHLPKWADWAAGLGVPLRVEEAVPPAAAFRSWMAGLGPERRPVGAGHRAPARAAHTPMRRVRVAADAAWMGARLKRLARQPGQLSDRAALGGAQGRLLDALAAVRARF